MRKSKLRCYKLIKEFDKVMSNIYVLPGYVLAISTGVAGLLASDPRNCCLFLVVVAVAVCFAVAMIGPISHAYHHIQRLSLKKHELLGERQQLHSSIQDFKPRFNQMENLTDEIAKRLTRFENTNFKLKYQDCYYAKFLALIMICGLLYIVMFVIAGENVLCGEEHWTGILQDCSKFAAGKKKISDI